MGTVDVMRHKIEVLRRHCEDVGRDPADITFTLGIKATIRDSEADADRVWKAAMEHNRTPLADVADDQTFWNGTAEQLAEKLAPTSSSASTRSSRSSPRPTTRDPGAPDRRGQTPGRQGLMERPPAHPG